MRNRLLTALSDDDRNALMPNLRPIALEAGTKLLPREHLGFCLFIESGLSWVFYTPDGGAPVSVGVIGADGMLGLSAIFDVDSIDYGALALTRCHAFAVRPADLKSLMWTRPGLQRVLLQYAHRRLSDTMHIAACYVRHCVDKRLSSCILRIADVLRSSALPLTHHQLGIILGVTRPSITLAMRQLEERRAISCHRNLIEVLNREALVESACSCHLLSDRGAFTGMTTPNEDRNNRPYPLLPTDTHGIRFPSPGHSGDGHSNGSNTG